MKNIKTKRQIIINFTHGEVYGTKEKSIMIRISRSQMFFKIAFLKNFASFTRF